MATVTTALSALTASTVSAQTPAQVGSPERYRELAREIFKELIEINTAPAGGTQRAAEAMAARLRTAGVPESDIHVVGPLPERANLGGRIPGAGARNARILL